jgi:gluconate 2-dehydrogenase gamma chain
LPEAAAETHAHPAAANAPTPIQANSDLDGHGAFLNDTDAETVAVFTERLMPGAPGKPGAREAGVLNYIDLALAGAYAELQDFYRRGLAQLDAYCRATYGQPFVRLAAAQQDEVITALEADKAGDGVPVTGVAGNPLLIQSKFGTKGNFELVIPIKL